MTTGTGAAAEPTTPSQGGKVFVGNLAFKTRNSGLKEAFEKIGPVQQVRVVTQGRRSLGYGFVLFVNAEDAPKAVEQYHRTSLDGREINVEVSTSPNTTPAPAANNNKEGAAPGARKNFKRKRTFKKKTAPAGATEGAAPATTTGDKPASAPESADNTKPKKPRKKRTPTKPKEPREPREPREPKEPATQPKRQPRAPRPPRENTDTSSTVVYVSNLPFSLTDDALKAEFADLGATSANIIRRKRNNQSKGFGFVEFATEAQQTAAIDAKHKSKIQDREISVRKAYVRPPTEPAAPAAAPVKTEA